MWKVTYNLDVEEKGIEKVIESGFSDELLNFMNIGDYNVRFIDLCNLIQNIANNKTDLSIYAQTPFHKKEKLSVKLNEDYKKISFGRYEIDAKEFISFIKFIFAKPILQSPLTELTESFKAAGLVFYSIAESKNPFFEDAHNYDEYGRTIEDYIKVLQIDELFIYSNGLQTPKDEKMRN